MKGIGFLPCTVTLFEEGLDCDSGEGVVACTFEGKCLFQESAKETLAGDKREVVLAGKALIEGDIAPGLPAISGGRITIFPDNGIERKMRIVSGQRVRIFNGKVNHTVLGLI